MAGAARVRGMMAVVFLAAIVLTVFAACQGIAGSTPVGPDMSGRLGMTTTPAPVASADMHETPAPIEHLQVNVTDTSPPVYFLHVLSGLPNGCVRFGRYDLTRPSEDTFVVTVTNLEPRDPAVACTQQYGTTGHDMSLGTLEAGRTYSITANGTPITYTVPGTPGTPRVGDVEALLGSSFGLGPGQTAVVKGEALKIRFERVLEDSRCPRSTSCVSAGRARLLVSTEHGHPGAPGQATEHELVSEPNRDAPQVAVSGYVVRLLGLDPYPGTYTGEPRYVASFLVRREGQ